MTPRTFFEHTVLERHLRDDFLELAVFGPQIQRFPYVYLDGLFMKMSFGDGVHHVAVLVAIGVDDDGFREVLGVCQGGKEDKESWLSFLRHLKERGLQSPELVTSDACLGLREALGEVFDKAKWQRCIVHFYRNASAPRCPTRRCAR